MSSSTRSLRHLFVPAERVVTVIGPDARYFSGSHDCLKPSLRRRWLEVRDGRQAWVSVDVADKLLTETGHHLWELDFEPIPGHQGGPAAVSADTRFALTDAGRAALLAS